MAVSVAPLPAYPSSRARASLSPSQLATLHQTISSSLAQTLALPPAQFDTSATRIFIASYAKDAAQTVLQYVIWQDEQKPSIVFADISQPERTIRQRAFLLAERLATSGSLDLQTLLDLSVAYGSTNPSRLRSLFSSAFSHNAPALLKAIQDEAIPAFTDLLSTPSQGLYGLRKAAHIILCLLRPAPAELVHPFARNKSFILALARAYDHGLSTLAQPYGGLRLPPADAQTPLDQWERLFIETKVALLDSFHILIRTLLASIASTPSAGPALAAQCESAFDVVFALLELPSSEASSTGSQSAAPTPFLNRPLLADYQHAYDFSRTLSEALKRADDARSELLESTLRSLDNTDVAGPGALKLLLRSSGIPPGIDHRGRGPSGPNIPSSANSKGKGKAVVVEADPALDAAVAQVLDILPDQPPEYLRFLLAHQDYPYTGDAERLIGALLEGTAPGVEEVKAAMARADVSGGGEDRAGRPGGREQASEEFVYTRRNVFDEEKMDLSNVRVGKKTDDASTVLQDRAFIDQMKADILRRAEEISDSEPEDEYGGGGKDKARIVAFEDELDEDGGAVKVRDGGESELDGPDTDGEADGDGEMDGDEGEGLAKKPETILELAYIQDSKQFERDGQTRRSKARADLRAQTGWTDEQIEGWKIMLERNPNKDKILAKHEFSGNKPLPAASGSSHPRGGGEGGRGRGGGGRGRGGRGRGGRGGGGGASEGGSSRDRAFKDKNKASRGNHNRKRGHDKKMARAGGPS